MGIIHRKNSSPVGKQEMWQWVTGDGCSWLVFRWCWTLWAADQADQMQRWPRSKFQTPPKTRSWLCWRAGEGGWRGRVRNYSEGNWRFPLSLSENCFSSDTTEVKVKSTNFRGHVARNSNECLTPPCQLHFILTVNNFSWNTLRFFKRFIFCCRVENNPQSQCNRLAFQTLRPDLKTCQHFLSADKEMLLFSLYLPSYPWPGGVWSEV